MKLKYTAVSGEIENLKKSRYKHFKLKIMKTIKMKSILPACIFMLAIVSAFAFKGAQESPLLTPDTGWINLPGQPCAIEVQCDNNPGPICTAIHNGVEYQAFGKTSEMPLICTKVLSRRF